MEISHDLEQLATLRKKGVLTQQEFETQKQALLAAGIHQAESMGRKQQLVYVLLAFFFGLLGIHNFYAGYKGRGIAQLVLTLLSPLTLFLSLIFVDIWVIINIFAIKKDASGYDFIPARGVQLAIGWVKVILDVVFIAGLLVIGGIIGFMAGSVRLQAREVLDYASRVATVNYARTDDTPVTCQALVSDVPDVLGDIECKVLNNENGSVILIKDMSPEIMNLISVLSPSQTVVEENTVGIQF